MRDVRRRPLLVRVAGLLSFLFLLTGLVLIVGGFWAFLSSSPRAPVDSSRLSVIAQNLILLGLACTFVVNRHTLRFRRRDREPFPLDSWQNQVRAFVVVAALPMCALVLAVVIPPTSLAWVGVFLISAMAAFVLVAAYGYALIRWRIQG